MPCHPCDREQQLRRDVVVRVDADPARGRHRDGDEDRGRSRQGLLRLHGRRRHERGRLPRRAQLRGRVEGAGGADLPEQPVGDLDAGLGADRGSRRSRSRASATASRRSASTATTSSRVYHAVAYAADKARRGDGPTFLELLTYRVSAHSSSDDPSRYRDEAVTEVWKGQRDPLRRLETYLLGRGWVAAGEREALAQAIEVEVREAIARQEAIGAPALGYADRRRVRGADLAAARAARRRSPRARVPRTRTTTGPRARRRASPRRADRPATRFVTGRPKSSLDLTSWRVILAAIEMSSMLWRP